jgi:hypothetical protein
LRAPYDSVGESAATETGGAHSFPPSREEWMRGETAAFVRDDARSEQCDYSRAATRDRRATLRIRVRAMPFGIRRPQYSRRRHGLFGNRRCGSARRGAGATDHRGP